MEGWRLRIRLLAVESYNGGGCPMALGSLQEKELQVKFCQRESAVQHQHQKYATCAALKNPKSKKRRRRRGREGLALARVCVRVHVSSVFIRST